MREDLLEQRRHDTQAQGEDAELRALSTTFMRETGQYRYTYNFDWMGVPIIQFPQDVFALQEIIWAVRPDVIVETGVAHGGGLVFFASMLHLLGGKGKVVGVDVEIRPNNRRTIESHPMASRIELVEGSSIDEKVFRAVESRVPAGSRCLVVLDSDHSKAHVAAELDLYSRLVKAGSYLVVFDTTIEDQPDGYFVGKPWNKENNPKVAVREFLRRNPRFEVDSAIENKLLITVAREGYLRCIA